MEVTEDEPNVELFGKLAQVILKLGSTQISEVARRCEDNDGLPEAAFGSVACIGMALAIRHPEWAIAALDVMLEGEQDAHVYRLAELIVRVVPIEAVR